MLSLPVSFFHSLHLYLALSRSLSRNMTLFSSLSLSFSPLFLSHSLYFSRILPLSPFLHHFSTSLSLYLSIVYCLSQTAYFSLRSPALSLPFSLSISPSLSPLSFSIALPFSAFSPLSLSPSLSSPLSLPCLSLPASLSFSHSFSCSISLFLFLYFSLSFSTLSFSISLFIPHSPLLFLSPSFSLYLSLSPTLSPSLYLFLPLSSLALFLPLPPLPLVNDSKKIFPTSGHLDTEKYYNHHFFPNDCTSVFSELVSLFSSYY